ncbi:DUF4326 domain-containing protein [Streptomyces mirabilis]|uniref:DUF4326 domain-containing protein n=1 Tax=Streptomyces mirabilis TaxID=68239 RepID=UPI0034087921
MSHALAVQTGPRRIQRCRAPGWRLADVSTNPLGVVYVGRRPGSRWHNPFKVVAEGRQWRAIDTGDRSAALRDEPQIAPAHYLARVMATRLFELHTGPLGLYAYSDDDLSALRAELAGRDLMCWCPPPEPGEIDYCHAAVLLRLANNAQHVDDRLTASTGGITVPVLESKKG